MFCMFCTKGYHLYASQTLQPSARVHATETHAIQAAQRGGTLENSGEMLGWELRELRLRVTRNNEISISSQMRNEKSIEKTEKK